jgi:hypothetical protein
VTTFKNLLDDIAGEARPVDVADRALAIGRRRRRLVRLGPVAVAALLAVVLLTTGLALRNTPPPRPATPAAPWYESLPASVTPPATAPPLPAGPVGGGLLLTSACAAGCPVLLYATDNRWYRVPGTLQHASLSPDGRWLWTSDGRHPQVRDLAGTRSFPPAEYLQVMFWSPGDRWALAEKVHPAAGGGTLYDGGLIRIELATGRTARFDLGHVETSQTLGVLPSGDLVVATRGDAPTAPLPSPTATLRTARGDLVIGISRVGVKGFVHQVTLPGAGLWSSGTEEVMGHPPVSTAWQWEAGATPALSADGTTLDYNNGVPPIGKPLDYGGRWAIIVQLATGAAVWSGRVDSDTPVRYLGGTELLARQPTQDRSGQLYRYDLATGVRQPVSQLPPNTSLPGEALDQLPT